MNDKPFRTVLWLLGVFGATSLAGCYVDSRKVIYDDDVEPVGELVRTGIEPDARFDVDPGEGIGVFIEVDSLGGWHVFTTCDTAVSDQPCDFRVVATVLDGTVKNVRDERLEGEDADTVSNDDKHVVLECMTYENTDGMTFLTRPEAAVRFKVFLDGALDPRFIYWVGDEAVHDGAPGDPIVLYPESSQR